MNPDFDQHIPVLLNEILDAFSVYKNNDDLRYFDGTFGRGGHFLSVKKMLPQMKAVALDQDLDAINYAQAKFSPMVQSGELTVIHKNFSKFSDLNLGLFDMMLLDLGVSSPQLDESRRGFSFYHNGPLDMRMDSSQDLKASDIVNGMPEKELNALFQNLGEIRKPFRVVRALVHDRKEKPFESTHELAGLIERVDGWHRKGHHPATNYFMALRLAVNNELDVVQETLPKMMEALKPGGRLAVISFHSLEDRIGEQIHKKVIIPTDEECEKNPRARSAKLRIFRRTEGSPEESGVQDERRKYKTS
jgi:16S rRNA (cytosine1402-N4)-methyltransferase